MTLRLEEALALTAALILLVLHAFGLHSATLRTFFTVHGGLPFVVMAVAYGLVCAQRDRAKPSIAAGGLAMLRFARDWLPFVVLIAVYENVLPLTAALRDTLYDEAMLRADGLVFDVHPTIWMEALVTPGRTEFFALFYLSLFAYPLVVGGLFYFRGQPDRFRAFMLAFVLAGYVGYAGYVLVPVVGPEVYFDDYFSVDLDSGAPLEGALDLDDASAHGVGFSGIADRLSFERASASEAPRNCFPSLHTAWALIIGVFAFRYARRLFYLIVAPLGWMLIATIYLRYHYVVDLACGGALAWFAVRFVPKLDIAWERRFPRSPAVVPPLLSGGWSARWQSACRSLPSVPWPYLAVLLVAGPAYYACLPDGLTTLHHGHDGAELVAAAMTGGIPHSPGYPLYMLIIRALGSLPGVEDPINAAHAFSAVCGLGAACLVVAILRRVLGSLASPAPARHLRVELPAAVGGLTLCFTGTFWNQCVIAEVYALHAFFVALLLWLALPFLRPKSASPRRALALAFTFGCAFAHHLSIVHILPAVAFAVLLRPASPLRQPRVWGRAAFAGLLGLLPLLYLPVAASQSPALNWGDPSSPRRFWRVVTAAQYHWRLDPSLDGVLGRLVASYPIVEDLGAISVVVAGSALIWGVLSPRAPRAFLAVVCLVAVGNLIGAGLYDIGDIRSYYLPGAIAVALLVGVGFSQLVNMLGRRAGAVPAIWVAAALIVAGPFGRGVAQADAYALDPIDDLVREIIRDAPTGALIVGDGDGLMFGLSYELHVRTARPDLELVNRDLLEQDWYVTNRARFGDRVRWPPGYDFHDDALNPADDLFVDLIRANYKTRPVLALRNYGELTGCEVDERWVITRCP